MGRGMEGGSLSSGLTATCSLKRKADAGSGRGRGRSLEESENASAVLSWLLGVFASLVQKRQISYP